MALPSSRDITLNPSDDVPSALLNRLQDCIVGRKKPTLTRTILPTWAFSSGTWNWTAGPGQVFVASGSSATGHIVLPTEVGERVTDVTVAVFGNGSADCAFDLWVAGASQVITTLCSGTDNDRSAAWVDLPLSSLGAFTSRVMGLREALMLKVAPNATGYRIGNITLTIDLL